jgi:3-hydroxy-9,10-secoandrosta-1,3,5(10)-triene-9,17-dione monooxygenase reductase component
VSNQQQDTAGELKEVMRLLPYPVTVITAVAGGRKRGITIGSFTSLSMDPPLISFNVTTDSQMHELLAEAVRFVVHIPGAGQQELCMRFALPDQSDEEQFDGLSFKQDKGGPPVLDGAIAEIHCTRFRLIPAGDHSIVIGRVERIKRNREELSILYCNGTYQTLETDG